MIRFFDENAVDLRTTSLQLVLISFDMSFNEKYVFLMFHSKIIMRHYRNKESY